MAAHSLKKQEAAALEMIPEAGGKKKEIAVAEREPAAKRAPKKSKKSRLEKDEEEEDLERLVLGDKAGFRQKLFFADEVEDAGDILKDLSLAVVPADEEDTGLTELDDNIVFFTDDGLLSSADPGATAAMVAAPAGDASEGMHDDKNAPAWEDSDDERLRVSLAGHMRLRKLRRFEGEDVVSGTEYAERLRQQYMRLNPQPDWAVEAQKTREEREGGALQKKNKNNKKKSARSAEDSSSEEDENEDDDDDALLGAETLPLDKFFRSASAMLAGGSRQAEESGLPGQRRRRRLQPETLSILRTSDTVKKHSGEVSSIAFHPRYAVLLTSSTSSMLHLHQVAPSAAPTPNPLLTSVRVNGMPIKRAAFLGADGERVIFAGARRFFHTWHLASGDVQRVGGVQGHHEEHQKMDRFRASPDGRHIALLSTENKGGGMINILSADTMQWVAHVRLDSQHGIADFVWWRNSSGLAVLGRDGRVGEWSLLTRRFVGVWRDEGSTGGLVLGLGGRGGPPVLGGDRWVAVGSRSGIVNIYERKDLVQSSGHPPSSPSESGDDSSLPSAGLVPTLVATPTPRRCFEQLVSGVTQIVFSPDGQLLVFASLYQSDALRIAHLPSCTVYRNWPTQQTPFGRITAVAFSPDSDMLAVGNDRGKTRLWEIRE